MRLSAAISLLSLIPSIPLASPKVLESFALSPTVQKRKVRYGAFLMGHQIRSLGGVIDVVRGSRDLTPHLEYLINIPM